MNTLELLIVLLPGLWLFAYYVEPDVGRAAGAVYLVGRFVYLRSYVADPANAAWASGSACCRSLPAARALIGAGSALLRA